MFASARIWFLVLSLAAPPAFATRVNRPPPNDNPWKTNHFLTLIIDNWKYKEPDIAIRDSGFLYGANYTYRNMVSAVFYELNFEYLRGDTLYEGFNLDDTPATADQTNQIGMGQIWFGIPSSARMGNWRVMPKVGFLYRYLLDSDDAVDGDYERRQQYFAIPIGLDLFLPIQRGNLVFQFYAPVYFQGTNKFFLTDLGGSSDVTVDQDTGTGFYLGVDYLRDYWIFGAFWRMWWVDDSESEVAQVPPRPPAAYYEPRNETLSLGLKVGVTF